MLTGGVSGSSSIMALLVGSKKWTLVGVDGAIPVAFVVKSKEAVAAVVDGEGTGWVLENTGPSRQGLIYER